MKRAKNPHFRPRNLANQPIKLEPSQRKKSVAPLYQVEDVGNAENQHQTGYHPINGAVSRSIQQPARSHQSDARMPRSTSTSGSRRACHSPLGWRHEAEEFARIHRTQDVEGIRTSSQDSEERVGMRFTALHQREDGTVRSTTTDSAATTTRHLLEAQSQRIEDLMRTLEGERRTHQSEMLSQIEAGKKRSILADQRYEKLTKEYQTCQETLVSVQREHDSLQQKLHAAQSALQTCESERKGEALHRQHIEQTRDYLSDHLRRATDDLERWKRRAQDAEALVMDLKIELKSGVELHHRCRQLEADLQAAREAHQHAVEEGEGWRRHSHEVERYVEEYETLRPEIQRLRVRYEEQQTALATLDKEKQFLTKHLTEGIETRDAEIARLRGLVSLPPSRDHTTVDGSALEEADIVSRLLVEQHELRNRLEEYRHQMGSTVSALREDVRLKEAERIYVQSRARNAEQKVEELSREIESLQKDRNSALGLRRDLEQALSEVREALS